MQTANAYAPIVKMDKNSDGTLTVYGKATDDSLDIDQQICDATWLDRAMPEWFKSGGNIREQHSSIASGVAEEYEKKEDGHYISALIVDPISVKKVETGVLKGLSIGIKSPRVVRDQKAANGRIIDGQIVEISLVDRPANPNAKLILAKSVAGESTLTQVEEFHEYKAPLPTEVFKSTNKGKSMSKVLSLIEQAKEIAPEIKKYDDAAFSAARDALAQLVIAEATEMKDGEDESVSLSILLNAIQALFQFHAHEAAEGETVMEDESTEEKSVDSTCACECAKCASGKGCDSKMCKCSKEADASADDSIDAEKSTSGKCLECGCHAADDSHGRTDVTTAELVEEKSAEAEEEKPAEEVKADEVATEEVATPEVSEEEPIEVLAEEKTLLGDSQIADILEKAVKSATESVQSEINLLKSAKEAAEKKVTELESDLAVAVTKAVAGGPKRSGTKAGIENEKNAYLQKAAKFSRMAENTTDSDLAKGYAALAKDFYAKANAQTDSE